MRYRTNRRTLVVEWGHCDPAGTLFLSRVFEYFDWSTALLFQANLGYTKSELQAAYGADIPLVAVKAEVLLPCRFCDVLVVEFLHRGLSAFELRCATPVFQSRRFGDQRPGDEGMGRPRPGSSSPG